MAHDLYRLADLGISNIQSTNLRMTRGVLGTMDSILPPTCLLICGSDISMCRNADVYGPRGFHGGRNYQSYGHIQVRLFAPVPSPSVSYVLLPISSAWGF